MVLKIPSSLFRNENIYSDEGRLLAENDTEGAGRNRTLVKGLGSANGAANTTLYTVPANKVLFVTSAWICAQSIDSSNIRNCYIADNTGWWLVGTMMGKAPAGYSTNANITPTFPMPLRFVAAQTIILYSQTSANASGGFAGWIEDA